VSTVLIAAAANLGPLKQRGEYQDATAFADTDALRALEAIARQHPSLVVLDSVFAATSRGTALINRIKADPTLSACEVRITMFTHDATLDVPVRDVVVPDAMTPADAAPQPATLLDVAGTRRSPRYEIIPGIELQVDGNLATLVDLSTTGAQVMAVTSLKPNQRVRLTLPGGLAPIRVSGAITWAVFEMSDAGPRYRAGVDFHSPDQAGIERFIEENKK
jgi:CheY-like chemotaxis protein